MTSQASALRPLAETAHKLEHAALDVQGWCDTLVDADASGVGVDTQLLDDIDFALDQAADHLEEMERLMGRLNRRLADKDSR